MPRHPKLKTQEEVVAEILKGEQNLFHLVFINACQHCKVESKAVGLYRTRTEADAAVATLPVFGAGTDHPPFQTQIYTVQLF